jgi:hypothetical protein
MNSEDTKKLHEALVYDCIIRTCLNCEFFNKEAERCGNFPASPVPAKVLVFGCPQWMPFIPF